MNLIPAPRLKSHLVPGAYREDSFSGWFRFKTRETSLNCRNGSMVCVRLQSFAPADRGGYAAWRAGDARSDGALPPARFKRAKAVASRRALRRCFALHQTILWVGS
jgi:hypothetical protein